MVCERSVVMHGRDEGDECGVGGVRVMSGV